MKPKDSDGMAWPSGAANETRRGFKVRVVEKLRARDAARGIGGQMSATTASEIRNRRHHADETDAIVGELWSAFCETPRAVPQANAYFAVVDAFLESNPIVVAA